MSVGSTAPRQLSQGTAGACAGVLLLFGAIVTLVVAASAHGLTALHGIDLLVIGTAASLGVVALIVPWDRLGASSTLVLVPVVLAVIAFSDHSNPDPYTAGLFNVVVGMWIGLFHRRGVTACFAPLIAFGYWLPRALSDPQPSLPAATVAVTMVTVMVGEVLGAMRQRLDATREQLVQSRERRFTTLAQGTHDATMVFDPEGVLTYVGPAVTELLGDEPAQLEGRRLSEFLAERVRGLDGPTYQDLVETAEPRALGPAAFGEVVELDLQRLDGRWITCEAVAQDRQGDPDIGGIVVHLRDVDARKRLEQRLHHLAYHDVLTGLGNRVRLGEQMSSLLAEGRLEAVVVLDLDDFKRVNDTAGHDAGDQLLRTLARRLVRAADGEDHVARLTSDEFAVLVPRGAAAHDIAHRVGAVVEDVFRVGRSDVRVDASVGVARVDRSSTAEELLRAADTAMHVAKAQRGTAVVEYEQRMRDDLLARLTLESQIRSGLQRGEFIVHYQPKIDLRTGRAVGAEALVRWRHPELGLVPPGRFIEVAEDTGLIVDLGRSVLQQATRAAARWQAGRGTGCEVAVNVSPRQFDDTDVAADVRTALEVSGLDPRLLTVEVTESLLLSDLASVRRQLDRLKAMGVSLALDDFGTGFASLSYLREMPFDLLKIDRSFVAGIDSAPQDLALVHTILQMAENLGMATLAEGIETPEQAELLTRLGCDFGQGYLYARPLPLDELHRSWELTGAPQGTAG